ncbi:MAG: NAD-binding protein [Erysipelotrichaceae bacterium]|nr:NAD-binding protein [Erysipelotrichaceae bacterium]
MKITIADGVNGADYIIRLFNNKQNDLVVINEDEDACHYLSINNDIPVVRGRCTRANDMREAGAENSDLFIALSGDDYKNYVACKTAKQLNIRRCIARVANPKNVKIFKDLGIDMVVSSTYLLGEQIRNMSSIENMVNALSLEDEKIFILELRVDEDMAVAGKTLQEIDIANKATVSSVIRDGKAIIPNGQTQFMVNDKVLIVTAIDCKEEIVNFFERKK